MVDEDKVVTQKYRITGDMYMRLRVQLFIHRTWHVWFMVLGVFVMLCFSYPLIAMALLMILSALYPLAILFYYLRNISSPEHKLYFLENRIVITAEGIKRDFGNGETSIYPWHSIRAMRCRKSYVLLFFGDSSFLYIPNESFLSATVREDFETVIYDLKKKI